MQIILLHFNLCVWVYVYVCALMQAMASQAESILKGQCSPPTLWVPSWFSSFTAWVPEIKLCSSA